MGWFGYGIYDGDETQTCHLDFLKRAGYKVKYSSVEILEFFFKNNKTVLSKEAKDLVTKNMDKILNKMPKTIQSNIKNHLYFKDDCDAVEWQMLLALCLDNKIKPSKLIKQNGILATEYLIHYHSVGFTNPSARRASLRRFLTKALKA